MSTDGFMMKILYYVWLSNNIDATDTASISENMLNAILLAQGQAYDVVYEPNHKYADIFSDLCKTAQTNNTGL